ncbi:MAG: T9SS type A sorting domain-containing protein [Bacteroidales bacterium]|nr:T9SS type A sorting domain-containing protein [Bacteroidales bacterium]
MKGDLVRYCLILMFLAPVQLLIAQFDPPAGQNGSHAMYADSLAFIGWATSVVVERGWMEAGNQSLGLATYGNDDDALGKADFSVVSLGDGGVATITFGFPLWDGPGPDFAVFENSFSDDFLELAFVEVSSDGEYFARFPAVSLTQSEVQVNGFGLLDATMIQNLAGKYRALYGVPFDLEELKDDPNLNIQQISAIRIVDVVGSIDPLIGTTDVEGRLVNDPWPTPFPSSGFDLDAVGVIHDQRNLSVNVNQDVVFSVYPNPTSCHLSIGFSGMNTTAEVLIFDMQGKLFIQQIIKPDQPISVEWLKNGLYVIGVRISDRVFHQKFLKF